MAIQSTLGKGTTFEVFFPALPDSGSPTDEGGAGAAVPFRLEGTLLVADDEPALRETSRAMVEGFGLEAVEACDGEEAWELFRARRSGLRGALLDLTMPRKGGLEVYRQIREVAPDFPILLVSGYSREEIPAPMAPNEPTVFLQKPFALGELRSALQRLFKVPGKPSRGAGG